jgi:hypothetical protein
VGRPSPTVLMGALLVVKEQSNNPPDDRESINWMKVSMPRPVFDDNEENEEGSQCPWSGNPSDASWCSGVHEKMERKHFILDN